MLREQLLPQLAEALVAAALLGEGEEACREALGRDLGPDWAGRALPAARSRTVIESEFDRW